MKTISSQTVLVAGAQLHVEQLGTPSSYPIVMIHGGPGADSRYLRPQCDALAELLIQGQPVRLIYYDQRGSERSPLEPGQLPGGYQVHVEDLEQLRLALHPPRMVLCGYSWGGLLALLYALRYPAAVDRLILISPAPPCALERDQMQQNLQAAPQRSEVQAFREYVLSQEPSLSAEEKRHYRFALAVAGYFADPYKALQLTPFRVISKVEQAIWHSLGLYDLRPQLSQLRAIPSLVLHGNQDVIPLASAQETATLMNATLVTLESCGHVPYIEAQNALWTSIATFLNSNRA